MLSGQLLSLARGKDPEASLLQKEGSKPVVWRRLLFQVVKRQQNKECQKLVSPHKYWPIVLQSLHDETGHLGVERAPSLIRDCFYWPKISN